MGNNCNNVDVKHISASIERIEKNLSRIERKIAYLDSRQKTGFDSVKWKQNDILSKIEKSVCLIAQGIDTILSAILYKKSSGN